MRTALQTLTLRCDVAPNLAADPTPYTLTPYPYPHTCPYPYPYTCPYT